MRSPTSHVKPLLCSLNLRPKLRLVCNVPAPDESGDRFRVASVKGGFGRAHVLLGRANKSRRPLPRVAELFEFGQRGAVALDAVGQVRSLA
jgi:hypothetical protein